MLIGIKKIKINITNYRDRELTFFLFQQFTLFIARVGWPGINFEKTDADVLIYKNRQTERERLVKEL